MSDLGRRRNSILPAFLAVGIFWAVAMMGRQAMVLPAHSPTTETVWVEGKGLESGIDRTTGLPAQIRTQVEKETVDWLTGSLELQVRNEADGVLASFAGSRVKSNSGRIDIASSAAALSLDLEQSWRSTPSGLAWDFTFTGTGKRAGHQITLDLPMLSPSSEVFTPSERGLIKVGRRPDYQAVPYGNPGVYSDRTYVLPLVSVFDVTHDSAVTIALPPDVNIPHFQVSWSGARTLRLELSHRAMGGGKPSTLRLLFYAHPADYRCVLKAYSDDFPEYFRPALSRGPYEASFYYHHIQNHPDFDEMARQNVRYLWSSFWFAHVGEYLPPEHEWHPYTESNWWRLGEMMSDEKINSFVKEMHDHGIAVFAFFNVDEYGGAGTYNGIEEHGDSPVIEQDRRARFDGAAVKDANGKEIMAWQGDKVMNPDRRYAFYPYLMEQVRRHLERLPAVYGFLIDRMDWASTLDYGHDDGFTMAGGHPAENMAVPISAAVQEVCRLSHEQGKRVFINQFYRIEMLRGVDGVCHENDCLPALGYLTPLRPAAAWNFRKPYHGDLLQFEAQLKRRLQFALFPHMIAHKFVISQQEPDPRAADLLEIYAPLFSPLMGKEQVLLPHCVEATGANDINLFRNGEGDYVVPVTSRTRFLSRRVAAQEDVIVSLHVPDAGELKWARVYSADGPPYRAALTLEAGILKIEAKHHSTASILVIGKGPERPLDESDAGRLAFLRNRLFGLPTPSPTEASLRPHGLKVQRSFVEVEGTQVGQWGCVGVVLDGRQIGEVSSAFGIFPLGTSFPSHPPTVVLTVPDEGMWFVPHEVSWVGETADGKRFRMAEWTPDREAHLGKFAGDLELPLQWCKPRVLTPEAKE